MAPYVIYVCPDLSGEAEGGQGPSPVAGGVTQGGGAGVADLCVVAEEVGELTDVGSACLGGDV
ncbi:hypothetical protein [Streptomyces sp. NPDC005799]|uniref:hypothetical protein n=1 Tax=Streptomyces sp. NPDC005799 TaxID=3154678 RepID=UPI003408B235